MGTSTLTRKNRRARTLRSHRRLSRRSPHLESLEPRTLLAADGPRIIALTPTLVQNAAFDHVDVTFDRDINAATFKRPHDCLPLIQTDTLLVLENWESTSFTMTGTKDNAEIPVIFEGGRSKMLPPFGPESSGLISGKGGLFPKPGLFPDKLLNARVRAGDYDAAIEALNKSMELHHGGDANEWIILAMSCWQTGEHDQARSWLDKADEWLKELPITDAELLRLHTEAADLIGVTDPTTINKEPEPD